MDYEQFRTEYQQVFDSIDNQPAAHFAPDLDRLRSMAAAIDSPVDRRTAENQIATIEGVLSYDDEPPLSPAMVEAVRAHARGNAADGTPAERIARAEAAMAEIGRIADAADPAEQASILDMNESLSMLITALEPEPQRSSPACDARGVEWVGPMSSAHVLTAGEQGSRRGGGQGGPERQGPEQGE
jgi:hypothetical protein